MSTFQSRIKLAEKLRLTAAVLLCLTILSACGNPGSEISPSQAYTELQTGAFLLDVREPEEYAAAYVPGAAWIPLGQLPSRLSEIPRDRMVIVMCRTGNRSAEARDLLLRNGFSQVVSLSGGIIAWYNIGLPIDTK